VLDENAPAGVNGRGIFLSQAGSHGTDRGLAPANGNGRAARPLMGMSKITKALKKQAVTSRLAAQRATDPAVARQMTTLAEAFRAQAAALKKKHKKKK
jgi:hypothetical protein